MGHLNHVETAVGQAGPDLPVEKGLDPRCAHRVAVVEQAVGNDELRVELGAGNKLPRWPGDRGPPALPARGRVQRDRVIADNRILVLNGIPTPPVPTPGANEATSIVPVSPATPVLRSAGTAGLAPLARSGPEALTVAVLLNLHVRPAAAWIGI